MSHSRGLPMEYWRWHMVRETGWTLGEVDALSMRDFHEYLQVTDGESKARTDSRPQPRPKARR